LLEVQSEIYHLGSVVQKQYLNRFVTGQNGNQSAKQNISIRWTTWNLDKKMRVTPDLKHIYRFHWAKHWNGFTPAWAFKIPP